MSLITYQHLEEHLKGLEPPALDGFDQPVYLIFGDEMLVEKAFTALIDRLMPAEHRSFGFEPLDGATAVAADVVERINTYGLSPGLKVVAWRDARLFKLPADRNTLLTAAREAFESGENRKAAGLFLRFLSSANLGLDQAGRAERESGSIPELSGDPQDGWVDDLLTYCRQNRLDPVAAEDQAESIRRAIEKGLPPRHFLVITTETADRRQGLFKLIRDKGLVVDCSVPKGNRRADKQAQEKVLNDTMTTILKPHRKKMDRTAFSTLCEKTGFDLRTFANNLGILIDYVGARDQISADDVSAVLQRTKVDPIYELTNAVSDRKLEQALVFLDSLLAGDAHPLQILAALTNQVRRLLLARDFAESPHGQAWFDGCPYNQFQSQVLPAMAAYDQQLMAELGSWQHSLSSASNPAGKAGRTRKAVLKSAGDLLLAKNPKNAYPLYLLMQKAGRFTKSELVQTTLAMLDTDRHLKSSAQDPKLVLERLIIDLCGVRAKRG